MSLALSKGRQQKYLASMRLVVDPEGDRHLGHRVLRGGIQLPLLPLDVRALEGHALRLSCPSEVLQLLVAWLRCCSCWRLGSCFFRGVGRSHFKTMGVTELLNVLSNVRLAHSQTTVDDRDFTRPVWRLLHDSLMPNPGQNVHKEVELVVEHHLCASHRTGAKPSLLPVVSGIPHPDCPGLACGIDDPTLATLRREHSTLVPLQTNTQPAPSTRGQHP